MSGTSPNWRAYPPEKKKKIIEDAVAFGTIKAAKINNVSATTVCNYLKKAGISNKRIGHKMKCSVCGKEFTVIKGTTRHCCSRACRAKYENEDRLCLFCGKKYTVIRSKKRKYCSHSCYAKSNRITNHPPKRRGSNWNTIRRRFKANPTLCRLCEKRKATDLHHIIPYKYFQGDYERANSPQNLIPLCQKCHAIAENYVRSVFSHITKMEIKNENA